MPIAMCSAVARAFPLFSKKASTLKLKARNVHVEFVVPDGVSQDVYKRLNIVAVCPHILGTRAFNCPVTFCYL